MLGFVWGLYLIIMQISHVWGKSPYLRAANHDHFQFLTHLHSDITEKFVTVLPLI